MSTVWPLQAALVTRLKADAEVSALVGGRVYDGRAPQGSSFPYIVTGDGTGEPLAAFGERGEERTIVLHIFSRYSGSLEVGSIANAVSRALRAPLELTGWGSARLKYESDPGVLVEDDGTRHHPIRYRLVTFESP